MTPTEKLSEAAALRARAAADNARADELEREAREPFQREERYIVVKRKHLTAARETALREHMCGMGISTVECAVVESDWPEYELVWQMIEARVMGKTLPLAPAEPVDAAILRGVGKINGDGWKDTTKQGDIVYVWNAHLHPPFMDGQYPRVGCEHWSASDQQYDFSPATAEDIAAIRATLAKRVSWPGEAQP